MYYNVSDAVIGIHIYGTVMACGMISGLRQGDKATFSGYFHRGFQTPTITGPIGLAALKYFIDKHSLNKVICTVQSEHRAARLYCRRIGMKQDGCLRREKRVGGVWYDYCLYSILKGELEDGRDACTQVQ